MAAVTKPKFGAAEDAAEINIINGGGGERAVDER